MSTRPPRLLIADDDAAIRRLIALVLRRENYQLTLVAGGVPALEHLQAETPDLVICDLNMPDLDGFQLLGAMRSVPALAGVPVLVVTAAGQPAQEAQAVRLGAAACVLKPFAQDHFLGLVRRLLAGR